MEQGPEKTERRELAYGVYDATVKLWHNVAKGDNDMLGRGHPGRLGPPGHMDERYSLPWDEDVANIKSAISGLQEIVRELEKRDAK